MKILVDISVQALFVVQVVYAVKDLCLTNKITFDSGHRHGELS